ncbi:DNA repair protein rad50 [Puccinia graminis f. sp. tritici]|uniref:DNA repair protein RAD50 n=2 Tax=Puccinia graminis f. sp. tritici TaxID=56615 RepID=A0A5B0QI67_PUCGR|nr:DNA repair protein rad50 [Puccinia graminis f. sp. tritici]
MSQIDKLAIRGIRSFDNQSIAVIQFYSPLTVIVGHNGSGKTTIIESLKYITTGDLPPNTKGGAFVHDPSIAGESVVMAEVLLRFKNLAGAKLIASRRLQVSKKKNTALTMKTLEGTLSYNDDSSAPNSKRRTISTKCAEMDSEVPRHLGISKAILENVIFCHQEESNWPLSEPASLKKKFDEIFEATKYTKALDNIKSIKKEAAVELKVDKEKYAALVVDKNRAEKLQNTIDKLTAGISAKKEQYKELEIKVKDLGESNKSFYEQAARFHQVVNEHSTLSDKKANKAKIAEDLKEDMVEMADSTMSQLHEQREQSKSSLSSHTQRLASAKSELATVEGELTKSRQKHQAKLTEFGQLKAQAQRKLAALGERQKIIVDVSSTHNIPEFQLEITNEYQVTEFFNLLRDRQKLVVTKLQSTKTAGKKAEEERQTEIYELKNQRGATQQQKQACSDRMSVIRVKIQNLMDQIGGIKVTKGDIKYLSENLEAKLESSKNLKEENENAGHDQRIKAKQEGIRQLEDARENLHAELVGLNRESDTRAKLSLKRSDVMRKQQGIEALIEEHGAKFRELVKMEFAPKTAEKEIISVLRMTERTLSEATQHYTKVTKDMQTNETKLQMNKSNLASTEAELETLEKKINRVTKGTSLTSGIRDTELEIQDLQRDLNAVGFLVAFHEKLLRDSKEPNKCGICHRMFKNEEEMAVFERHCQNTIDRQPAEKVQNETKLQGWKAQLERFKKILPLDISATKLRDTDITNLKKEISTLESQFDSASRKVEEAKIKVDKLKDLIGELEICKRSAADASRMSEEIDELQNEIKNLERDLESSGTKRTADQVQEELDDLQLQIGESKRELESHIADRDRKRMAIHNLESEIHQLELNLNSKRQQKKERDTFEAQREDFKKEIADLEQKTKKIEEMLKTFAEPLRAKEIELEEIRAENVAAEAEQTNELQSYNKSLSRLETINSEIQRFNEMDIGANSERCQREIHALVEKIKAITQQISKLQDDLQALDKEQDRAKALERNITDNIRYRNYKLEIQELEDKISRIDVGKAREACQKYDAEYHKAEKWLADLKAEQAKLGGEIGMDKNNLKEKMEERESDFKDIIKRHRAQLVKVKTVEIANQDLDKYAKALDQAIMKYHSHKMAEINDTIQTLWNKTYQGTDIDNISIKSENENAKSNRSYNYRVVMMKDQVEMDMRGRCSAGQKVLASIIIRLALAESFGTNCGILALDEPTTNLDKENIDALANSLAEIIKERRDQANFQLVVITHDEDFLNRLGQADVLDKYWRVSRNQQQKSIIERQRMI